LIIKDQRRLQWLVGPESPMQRIVVARVKVGLMVGLAFFVLLTACSQPIETQFIHDSCLSSRQVSMLVQRKRGVTTTTPGPHPSHKTEWRQFSLYTLSYDLSPGNLRSTEGEASQARVELLSESAAPVELDKQPTFSGRKLPCEFSQKDHFDNVLRVIYFSDKNYDITGFSGKKTTAWAFEDELGQCFLKKIRPPAGNFVVSCPSSGLMVERPIHGDNTFFIDSAHQRIFIVEADTAAGHLIPATDKRLSIWRYRRDESLDYVLAGVKKL